MAFSKFDSYSRKARIAPALLALAPAYALIVRVPEVGWLAFALPLLLTAAVGLLAEQLVRGAGRATEARLKAKWGGFPTTVGLRSDADVAPEVLKARRRDVERVSGVRLPTKRDEIRDSGASEERYESAVRRCLSLNTNPLLKIESANYGFRRNLRALKPTAITVAIVVLAAIGAVGWNSGTLLAPPSLVVSALILGVLLFWLTVIRDDWVKAQADIFAGRFFDSLG